MTIYAFVAFENGICPAYSFRSDNLCYGTLAALSTNSDARVDLVACVASRLNRQWLRAAIPPS
ncbi:hypothetical protein [Segnochrobactrum spirostomi]|uniref:hypothetical protein n=1 Tax=Segnochrobactrum spirostomi TaxID=2608987 RepID=UPI001AD80B21|nr:hypothetical protein [Segnochrobactrum spirostomi]